MYFDLTRMEFSSEPDDQSLIVSPFTYPDVIDVAFTAACPACGADVEWNEERWGTEMHVSVLCDCESGA